MQRSIWEWKFKNSEQHAEPLLSTLHLHGDFLIEVPVIYFCMDPSIRGNDDDCRHAKGSLRTEKDVRLIDSLHTNWGEDWFRQRMTFTRSN